MSNRDSKRAYKVKELSNNISNRDKQHKINSRLEIESPKLLKEVLKHLKENDQKPCYSTSLGIVENQGNVFLSSLDAFSLTWKMTFYFNQVATSTVQHGDMALIDAKTQKNNNDTKVTYNLGYHQCWFNAKISTRVSSFSRSF